MTIQRIKQLVSTDFEAVNTLILEKIKSDNELINNLSSHIVQSGGKRLRPLLVLLSSHACGYQGQEHIILAAMIEFFHTATLLHDDVVDESTLRRGRETANEIWGSKASILVGDYLFTLYMHMMMDIGDMRIMRLLTDISHQITDGELKQLSNRHRHNLSTQDYFDVIRSKTSLLFAASTCLGALISHTNSEIQHSLYQYGLHLGNAFQLIDDILDYSADTQKTGKNLGDDLADGKATLPLLHALKHTTPDRQTKIRDSLTEGTLAYLSDVLTAIHETDAIDYTRKVAALEVEKAIAALTPLKNSEYKTALEEIAHYALERDH